MNSIKWNAKESNTMSSFFINMLSFVRIDLKEKILCLIRCPPEQLNTLQQF